MGCQLTRSRVSFPQSQVNTFTHRQGGWNPRTRSSLVFIRLLCVAYVVPCYAQAQNAVLRGAECKEMGHGFCVNWPVWFLKR